MLSTSPTPVCRQHLVLVGFACSGKSTIGRLLADRLDRTFVDLDEVIARETGHSIAEFVRQQGVVALRARERALVRQLLAHPQPLVIATGSDTFLDPLLREWLNTRAASVHLEADAETLVRRMASGDPAQGRPLKPGPNLLETVRRLLAAATPTYRQAALTVHNDGERIEDVLQEIAHQLRLDRQEHGRALRRAV
jgi:shikimate kinase